MASLFTPEDKALISAGWREYPGQKGRTYWFNSNTCDVSWERPNPAVPHDSGDAQLSPNTDMTGKCPYMDCQFKSVSAKAWRSHILSHAGTKPFEDRRKANHCEKCGIACPTQADLTIHSSICRRDSR